MALSVTEATSAPALVASKRTLVVRTPMWPLRDVALPLLATRLALTLVGLVASSGNFMATWANWDAGWYLSIALHGYGLDGQNDLNQANSAFAPALPLLMHVASFLVAPWASPEAAALVGGVLIANVALFVALA